MPSIAGDKRISSLIPIRAWAQVLESPQTGSGSSIRWSKSGRYERHLESDCGQIRLSRPFLIVAEPALPSKIASSYSGSR
jgi:hypothetical protein